jgi:hypothetical protein
MGFVRQGDYPDVFVSYASLDNQGETRWVTNLVSNLKDELGKRLGSKAVQIWQDDDALDGNHPFPQKIIEAVHDSPTLLIVMSEGYLVSEWCARERNAFLKLTQDLVADGRVFIVHCRNTDPSARPREFGGLRGYEFWTQDANARGATRPLGWPDMKEAAYWTRLLNLSDELARKLKSIKAAEQGNPPGAPSATVFLARSTDDMVDREDELKNYLIQAGLRILPETWYVREDERAFRAAMEADLARCNVYVQLLSPLAGRRLGGPEGRRDPVIQHDIARDAKKPILQWREPGEDPAVADPDHRALLEGARACGFEEFKRAVVEATLRKPAPPPPFRPPGSVFVNAHRGDLGMARELSTLLVKRGLDCFLPMVEGSPEKVREDLEASLKACDGLVLVYGDVDPFWVREQWRQGRKILSQREQALLAHALYLGPPPEKLDLQAELSEVIMLDGRQGLRPEVVGQFIERLTTATAEG